MLQPTPTAANPHQLSCTYLGMANLCKGCISHHLNHLLHLPACRSRLAPREEGRNKPEAEVDPAPAPTRSITRGRYVSGHTKTHRFCALFSFTLPSLSTKRERWTGPRLKCFDKLQSQARPTAPRKCNVHRINKILDSFLSDLRDIMFEVIFQV